ncbi:uncharacterized protein RCO7_02949 [Rhynchosporium graminicola]|uniref:Xaa-Pro dipeptidyl-peptidase C-terminal domain-containing protein n=1 Tax=Rhynchosporium graminicola TaxID=2792576 RepID=A0A1E1LII6_9HELO|nr:uncharacterized protein RCO7_02949 [Rhynchosporium commune]
MQAHLRSDSPTHWPPKTIPYVPPLDGNVFTVFVILRKKDKKEKIWVHLKFPLAAKSTKSIDDIAEKFQMSLNLYPGSNGILSASNQAVDSSRSIYPQFQFNPHTKQDKVEPGTVITLNLGIRDMGVDFDAGENISVREKFHHAITIQSSQQRSGSHGSKVNIQVLRTLKASQIQDQRES